VWWRERKEIQQAKRRGEKESEERAKGRGAPGRRRVGGVRQADEEAFRSPGAVPAEAPPRQCEPLSPIRPRLHQRIMDADKKLLHLVRTLPRLHCVLVHTKPSSHNGRCGTSPSCACIAPVLTSHFQKNIGKHYTRLLSLWPKDALRPTQPFTKAIEHRALPYGVAPLPDPTQTDASKPPAPKESAPPPSPPNPQAELANINALYSLLGSRYSTSYKLSPGVLKPTSNPEHYDRLMDEIARAPTKTWLQAKLDEWKMKIRWR
jgi:cytochrome b pre-mRNA-processing protein 6